MKEQKKLDMQLVSNCDSSHFEKYINNIYQHNQLISLKEINFLNQQQNISNIPNILNQQQNLENFNDFLIKPVIEYLFLIYELNKILIPNKPNDIQSFMEIIKSKAGPKLKKVKTYKSVFELILTSLDSKAQVNKEYYNLSEQYDEEKGLKRFMERYNEEKNDNIIKKLFLIPREEAIFCKKCKMNSFQFGFDKFIYIDNPQIGLIQKLFLSQKKESNGNFCNFCNGITTECSIIKKVLAFPEKLIVIIDPNQINNFVLQANLLIQNNNQITYKLDKFIDANTNILYKVDETNNLLCEKFINNKFTSPEKLENKKPIVLFYNLMKNPINISQLNNMQNQQNINNINAFSQNNNAFNANNHLNAQQIPISQNVIPQNNVQNVNQLNNIHMNFQQMQNQQNMNNQNNFHANMNPQGFNQQNIFQNFNRQNPMNNNNFLNNMNNFNNMPMMNNMDNNNMNFQNPYEEIQNLKNKIKALENENKELKLKINALGSNKHKLVYFDQIRVVQFISDDNSLSFGIECLPSDTFAEVEEKLYKIYPEYRETNNIFQVDGRAILRFKTIAENNIPPGHKVKIFKCE